MTAAVAPIAELEMQVEIGFLVGAVGQHRWSWRSASSVRMQHGVAEGVGSLITQIEHEPLEI